MLLWAAVALVGAVGWGVLALARGEEISAVWLVLAALGSYAIAYRFYSRFVVRRVLKPDDSRATPAERLDDGVDFQPTDRRVLLGHHFAAIAGAGPLVGPVLAAQMGYLPGTLWIVAGVIFAGAVQDMVVLFLSMRRDGKSLGQMAREEIGRAGGAAALIAVFAIMIILLGVLALVVVNALAHSPWGTFSVAMTIPIALFMGFWMHVIRPGRVVETSLIGVALLLLAIVGGSWIQNSSLADTFTLSPTTLVFCLVGYGFVASVLPVWMLLAPRDYLSTFMKIGTIALLAVGVVVAAPVMRADAVSDFASSGAGPVFAGSLFPFLFITIACGALSGFHALVASGTTPKLIQKESQVRMIGYGAMLMESFVAIMALIAAATLEPGLYYAMNAPAGLLGTTAESASQAVAGLGFTITPDQLTQAAKAVEEQTLVARSGGAPTLAVGMSEIFSGRLRRGGPEGLLVPLRDHVRGTVHPDDRRRGHPGRTLHAPGHARQRLEAHRPGQLEARNLAVQRTRRGRLGLLPLHRRHRPARRNQPALPAVRHRQPAAGRRRPHRLHDGADQIRPTALGLGHRRPARLGGRDHLHRRLAEDLLRRPPASASSPSAPSTPTASTPVRSCRPPRPSTTCTPWSPTPRSTAS